MNEYNRRVAIIERLARFCPICGSGLVTTEKRIGEYRSPFGRVFPSYTLEVEGCPNGHGTMSAGAVEDGINEPHAIFELNEALFEEEAVE